MRSDLYTPAFWTKILTTALTVQNQILAKTCDGDIRAVAQNRREVLLKDLENLKKK